MIDSLLLVTNVSSASLLEQVAREHAAIAKGDPAEIVRKAVSLQRLRGRAETLRDWERKVESVREWAVFQSFSAERHLSVMFREFADMLVGYPDDDCSGRSGDLRRCYGDGRREAMKEILMQLKIRSAVLYDQQD